MNAPLEGALHSLGLAPMQAVAPLAGGSVHQVVRVDLTDGQQVVCKIAAGEQGGSMLNSERLSLEALAATESLRVPHVWGQVEFEATHVLVTEYLQPGQQGDWAAAGRALARLHSHAQRGGWGWSVDTWLGGFLQPNSPMDDWHGFLRERRLEPQARLAVDQGLLPERIRSQLGQVIDQLEALVPVPQCASLLHGDLWSGNWLVTSHSVIAVIDPALWVGDAWSDIAMARLFGGVPEAMFDAWKACWNDQEAADARIGVHQLYHMLNHLNLFGSGYLNGVSSILSSLV
ncbi:MAG: fructosamine kinase family protein [Phycisphaerales bacterium]|nr:fructosamine kinase family protein [Phycisphaerales bacterium]